MTEVGLPGGVNPLDFLHKLATQRGLTRPEFLQLGEQGLPHNKLFMWQCSFNNVVAQATGRSKKEAKVAAARAVRDQLNFEELPPAPTHQSVIEKKKRKIEGGENGDGKGKKQKYDYNRHFQCYGAGNQGFGMGMPYGYLPTNGMEFSFDPFMGDGSGDPNMGGPYQQQDPGKGFMSRLSKLDRYVIKRHSEIYPSEDHLNGVLKLVSNVEEVMKAVSQEWNKDEENDIKIEGMVSFYLDFDFLLHTMRFIDIDLLQVRVGDLSKGLLLAPDRSVSLVLLCISEPSKTMLKKIHVAMRAKMKESGSEHDTLLLEKEAAFAVSKPLKEGETDTMFCYVTFTSTALRKKPKKEEEAKKEGDDAEKTETTENGNGVKKEEEAKKPEPKKIDPKDALPKDKCLRALAELRHSRWFASRCAPLPSCVECIRIMRDLSRRDPVWSCLSEWAIELLVERALYSAWRPLNPAASLMRVMEICASGALLDNEEREESFKDPCEREESAASPLSNLTKQEAEDITKSAQYYLRLMHFRQIYKVLGMQMEETEEGKGEAEAEDAKEDAPLQG